MTTTSYFYPQTISQTSGSYQYGFHYQNWVSVNNLKKRDGVAKCNVGANIDTANRPATLTLTDFQVSLPTGAEVQKISVQYSHQKTTGSKGIPNVGAPSISFVGISSHAFKGFAPQIVQKSPIKSISVNASKSAIESKNFGIKINYPKNTNGYKGYIELAWVRIRVTYITPKYSLSVVGKTHPLVGTNLEVTVYINNLNKTNYNPSVAIQLNGDGINFRRKVSGDGTLSGSGRTMNWEMGLSQTKKQSHITFSVYISSSSEKSITFTQRINGVTVSKTLKITPQKTTSNISIDSNNEVDIDDSSESEDDDLKVVVRKNEEFYVNVVMEQEALDSREDDDVVGYIFTALNGSDKYLIQNFDFYLDDLQLSLSSASVGGDLSELRLLKEYFTDGMCRLKVIPKVEGSYVFDTWNLIYSNDGNWEGYSPAHSEYISITIVPLKSELSTPSLSVLELSEEELNRLGSGKNYIVQSYLKETTEDENARDWLKNNRIGVFNNALSWKLVNKFTYQVKDVGGIDPYLENYADVEVFIPDEIVINEDTVLSFKCTEGSFRIHRPNESLALFGLAKYQHDIELIGDEIYRTFSFQNRAFSFHVHENITDYGSLTLSIINDDVIDWQQEYTFIFHADEDMVSKEVVADFKAGDYENLTLEDIFNGAEYWSNPLTDVNTFEKKECEFVYNPDYPLYILFVGDYLEAADYNYHNGNLSFTTPVLYEIESYEDNDQVCFPEPILNLLDSDDPSSLTVGLGESANPLVLYDFDVGDDFETGDVYAIRGVKLSMDVESSDEFVIFAKLRNPQGKTGERSIVIDSMDYSEDSESNVLSIGADFDLWGFKISDMKELQDWDLELICSNAWNTNGESELIFKNIEVTFYYMVLEKSLVDVFVEGEDIKHYGMFLTNIKIPSGLKSKIKYHEIDGSDYNSAYRMNIDKKEITLEFDVDGCDIFETTELLRNIAKLLTNERDKLNKPIPKRLECSQYPGEHWDYVMEEPIDSDVESACYSSTAKLFVPEGTSWSNEDIVTSDVGMIDSIAKVNPVILIHPNDSHIEIIEENSEQKFVINYDYRDQDIIEIDCTERTVTLYRLVSDLEEEDYVEIDISEDADYHNDWFLLNGEYNFTAAGCEIETVSYTQRG